MLAKARKLLIVAVLAAPSTPGGSAHAQAPSLPAPGLQTPQPLDPAPPPPPPPPPQLGPPQPLPPVVPVAPLAPPPPPPPPPSNPAPLALWPYDVFAPGQTVFTSVELVFLRPFLPDRLHPNTRLPDGTTLLLPTADLSWTVSPKFEVGWTLPEVNRLAAISYRFIDSSGNGTVFDAGGNPSAVRTGFNFNIVDFDIGNLPTAFAPQWDVAYRFGIRTGDVYFDTSLANNGLTQRASNLFYGAGPHGRLDVQRHLAFAPGLALFGRADGAALVGQLRQHFQEAVATSDGGIAETDVRQRRTQVVPALLLQAGLSYTPPGLARLHLTAGYQYEQWWYLGQLGLNSGGGFNTSHGDYSSQGAFVRALFEF